MDLFLWKTSSYTAQELLSSKKNIWFLDTPTDPTFLALHGSVIRVSKQQMWEKWGLQSVLITFFSGSRNQDANSDSIHTLKIFPTTSSLVAKKRENIFHLIDSFWFRFSNERKSRKTCWVFSAQHREEHSEFFFFKEFWASEKIFCKMFPSSQSNRKSCRESCGCSITVEGGCRCPELWIDEKTTRRIECDVGSCSLLLSNRIWQEDKVDLLTERKSAEFVIN